MRRFDPSRPNQIRLRTMHSIKSSAASFFEEAFFQSTLTYIHPTASVGPDVILGNNVKIGPGAVIVGNVTIEDNTRVYPYVIIGFPAQNLTTKKSLGTILIKKNCELREFVTIHASKYEDGQTVIGNNNYLMNYAHVAHDCILEDNVTLINNVTLGGHTYIERNSFLMAGAATHQFCRIGKYVTLAPFSGIRQDLPPFGLYDGRPAGFSGLNLVGLRRAGLTQETLSASKKITKLFYFEKKSLNDIEATINTEKLSSNEQVQAFMTFIKNSSRGVSRATTISITQEESSSL